MSIDWQTVCVALASRLQFEVSCGRRRLINEESSRLFLAEVVQTQISGEVEPELNHPDLPGDTRIDLVVRSRNARNIEVAMEHKWVRTTTETSNRNWMAEIVADIVRVNHINRGLAQNAERLVIVSGEVPLMRTGVWEAGVQQGNGQPLKNVVAHLLQPRLEGNKPQPAGIDIQLRNAGLPFKKRFSRCAELKQTLPTKYRIHLVGFHRAESEGVECAAWKVSRGQGQRSTFDMAQAWA